MMKKKILISVFAIVIFPTLVHSAELKEYLSPDSKYRAYIISLPKSPEGSVESKVVIRAKNNKILCSKSYGSEDGEHGFGVEKAAWTPDSKFFVYSLSSSGGHQSWHFPTDFISVKDFKVRNLDNYVGPITDQSFILKGPDTIEIVGRDKSTPTLEESHFKVRFSELVTREKMK